MFSVLEEEDAEEEVPASEDEDEEDQSPRARLMRGISCKLEDLQKIIKKLKRAVPRIR